MMKLRVMLLPALAATAVLAACGGGSATETTATGELQTIEPGVLTVGSDIPYEPFEGGDPPDYEGFDIDIVNGIADRLELDVEIVDTPFDTIFTDLAQDKFDMVASSTSITPERLKEVDFTVPYFQADQSLMIKDGSDITSVDDLGGRTIGAQKGTTGATYAEEDTDAADVRTYPEIVDAFDALQNEQIEAVVNDFAISKFAEESKPDLTVIETIPTDEVYGLAIAKGNTQLLGPVDAALEEMIADGSYAEIYEKWFEEEPPKGFRAGE